jgi:hypothetical protein
MPLEADEPVDALLHVEPAGADLAVLDQEVHLHHVVELVRAAVLRADELVQVVADGRDDHLQVQLGVRDLRGVELQLVAGLLELREHRHRRLHDAVVVDGTVAAGQERPRLPAAVAAAVGERADEVLARREARVLLAQQRVHRRRVEPRVALAHPVVIVGADAEPLPELTVRVVEHVQLRAVGEVQRRRGLGRRQHAQLTRVHKHVALAGGVGLDLGRHLREGKALLHGDAPDCAFRGAVR